MTEGTEIICRDDDNVDVLVMFSEQKTHTAGLSAACDTTAVNGPRGRPAGGSQDHDVGRDEIEPQHVDVNVSERAAAGQRAAAYLSERERRRCTATLPACACCSTDPAIECCAVVCVRAACSVPGVRDGHSSNTPAVLDRSSSAV